MPGWLRKIGQGPAQQDAYRLAKLVELTAKAAADCCPPTTTTTTTTTTSTTTTTTTTL